MLSLDLFDSKYEKKLHEGAVDDAEFARLDDLRKKIKVLDLAREKTKDPEMHRAIDDRKKVYADEIKDILSVRGMKEAEQPAQPPAKGLVKGKDLVTPQQRVAGATPAKPGVAGAVKDVAGGIKRWLQGKPDQGPTYEAYTDPAGQVSPRATGNANMGLLIKANSFKQVAPVTFEFPNMAPVPLTAQQTEVLSDYYDGLADSGGQNHFIYNVLSSYQELDRLMNKLGAPLKAQVELLPAEPGAQGQLPLQEKKKSKEDDLEAGDIKVARELQKLRAEYPAARSDVEAVARAEIDSTERNQRQLTAIRGANEKQDALLKQLVDLDQQQGREIDGLDKENNSLEQRLAQIQATNDRLQQTIGKMTGTKKSATTVAPARPSTSDAARGGIIDVGTPVASIAKGPVASIAKAEPETQPTSKQRGPEVFQQMTRTITAPKNVSSLKAYRTQEPENDAEYRLTGTEESVKEHGGGIGPKQHWQDLMQEGQPQELINRYLAIDAETDVDAVRKAIQAISRDSTLSATSKSRLLGQIGMIIQRHRLPIGRSYYTFMQQYMEAVELDRNRVAGYPNDPATVKHRLDTAKAILSDPRSDADSRREAAAIVAKSDKPGVNETVENVRAGMAKIYRRLAPKIERHRDSFLAGQLYDELENYAELHGAEGEFKRMMATARNSAHMEYDTNPGGFQNWFWFLPFEDNMEEGIKSQLAGAALAGALALGAGSANARVTGDEDPGVNRLTGKPNVTQAVQGDQVKPSAPTGFSKEYLQSVVDGTHPRPMITKEKAQALLNQLKEQGVAEGTDDIKKRMSKLEALALAANRAGDDAKCKMYQQKIQSLKQKLSQSMAEGWSDQGNPTAYSVYIDGREWRAYKSDDHARAVAEKVRANLKRQGRDQTVTIAPSRAKQVQEDFGMPGATIPLKSVIQGYTVFFNPKTQVVSVTRGGDSEEAAIEQQKLSVASMKNFRQAADRLIDKIESDLNEAKQILTKNDFLDARDYLLRKIDADSNPANKQIIRAEIRKLESQAETEGWITMQQRMVREDSDSGEAVEMAIMRRMLVAHTDLIVEFGLDKVVDAIEEVAYNVGDTDEIGTSDVSGWVNQVQQILGADA